MEYLRRGREYFHKNTIPEAFASLDATYHQVETANKTHAELLIPKDAEGNTVVVAPGFADKSRLYHQVMVRLAQDNRVVYCLQHTRFGMPIYGYEDETDRMTHEVLSVIDHAHTFRPDARIDLLGTSFGSIAVGKAALQLDTKPGNKELWANPLIETIILNSPAGLTKDTLWELAKGMTQVVAVEGAYDIKKGDFGQLRRDTVDFVQYNANFPRSLKEGWDIAHTDISEDLAVLGDRIWLIHTPNDSLFPINRVFAGADRARIPAEQRYILPGRHGGFIDARFIKTVRGILTAARRDASPITLPNGKTPTQIFPQPDEKFFISH